MKSGLQRDAVVLVYYGRRAGCVEAEVICRVTIRRKSRL